MNKADNTADAALTQEPVAIYLNGHFVQRRDIPDDRPVGLYLAAPTPPSQIAEPSTKLDNFLEIVRVAVERDGCSMDAILSRLYSVAPIPALALPVWWNKFIVNVCEIPDRNSPEDEPDAMIATAKELENCALCAMESFVSLPLPPVAQAAPAPKFYAVMNAAFNEGVIFDNPVDAKWTATGKGLGENNFGYPEIGENFRQAYSDEGEFKVTEFSFDIKAASKDADSRDAGQAARK